MPVCCSVMRKNMRTGDHILHKPPKGNGATLRILYHIPRSILLCTFVTARSLWRKVCGAYAALCAASRSTSPTGLDQA